MNVFRYSAIVLCIVIISGCGFIKKSESYKMSIRVLESNAKAKDALGEIKKYGWFPTGEISVKDGEGHAKLKISVVGTLQKGVLKTELEKEDSPWKFKKAVLKLADGSEINLLEEPILPSDRDVYIEPDDD